MARRLWSNVVTIAVITAAVSVVGMTAPAPAAAATTVGPLHTTGTDSLIYDSNGSPVRLVGFNWTGTEEGGRADLLDTPDVCGKTWRTPADRMGNLTLNYDDFYTNLAAWGYNVIRLPIAWHNLEPVPPVWNEETGRYDHTWNQTYLDEIKSMVRKARDAGVMVILDMHQDYWSPALHNITNWDGSRGYCEGVGMPRWLYPSIDAKPSTTQNTDFFNGMNWFFRNVHDPASTVTRATPWQLLGDAWSMLSHQFSAASGFAEYDAVVGADLFNEPYWSYAGGNPPAGQTVLETSGQRLKSFYESLAPAVTTDNPSWLLFFQDGTGGYNAANPSVRETPTMQAKPSVPGNWVYSVHNYNFSYGTFADGVVRHDDFGITVANAALTNARAWGVPLYIGEFTIYSLGVDARQQTEAGMAQTRQFLAWAKQNDVSWTFWAYVNGYRPMTLMDYATNLPIPAVKNALETGLGEPPPNSLPVAQFTAAGATLQVSFDATASRDPDGQIGSFAWDFGDGQTGTGSTTVHNYTSPGLYSVTLTVTDDRGAVASVVNEIVVEALPDTTYAYDTFSRTTSNGLGMAEVGGSWTVTGGTGSYATSNGAGRLSTNANTTRSAVLADVQQTSLEVSAGFSFDKAQTGGGTYLALIGRRVSSGNDYRLKLRVQSSGAVTAQLVRVVGNVETVLRSVSPVPGLSWSQGQTLRARLRVSGTAPTVLVARVWRDGSAEPSTWQLQATDTTATLQSPGGIGVWTNLTSTATQTPMIVAVDDVLATPLPANVAPTALFTSTCSNLTCSFDASASTDSDGAVVGQAWNFGDGQLGSGATAARTYAAAGTYTVTLTVSDDRGDTATTTGQVTVTNPPALTTLASDTFTRIVSNGWGTATVGGAWSSGSPSNLSVSNQSGAIRMASGGSGPSAYLASVSADRTDMVATIRTDKPATGGGIYISLVARRVVGAGDYRGKIRLMSNGQVTIEVSRATASGVESPVRAAVTVPGLVYSPAVGLRMRVQVFGTGPTTIRAKVWPANATEPTAWNVSGTDTTANLQTRGAVGFMSYLSGSATNAPVVTRFDDLVVTTVP